MMIYFFYLARSYKCWKFKVKLKVKSFNCNLYYNHLNIILNFLFYFFAHAWTRISSAEYAFQTEQFLHL